MPDLKLLSRDDATGRLRPALSRPPETVEGVDLLVQIVALTYLTNPGRSIVFPNRGGGLRRFIGSNFDVTDPSELFADLRLLTSQVEQVIKQEQEQTARLPSERLASLQLIDIIPVEDQLEVDMIVQIIAEDQQQTRATVVA